MVLPNPELDRLPLRHFSRRWAFRRRYKLQKGDQEALMADAHIVYVDDSGTDPKSRIVTAAFCVSTNEKWQEFEHKWKQIACRAGFQHFHMTEFAACKRDRWCKQCTRGHTTLADHPWRAWSTAKRENVLNRLAKTVIRYVECGFGIAVTKQDFEEHVRNSPARQLTTEAVGDEPFTYAVQQCGGELAKWRAAHGITAPLGFIFDLTPERQREELARVFFAAATDKSQYKDGVEQWFRPTMVSYESRRKVVQLLAADMLAWATATFRARDLFRRGEFVEVYQLVYLFTGTHHIRLGYTPKQAFEEWERNILKGEK